MINRDPSVPGERQNNFRCISAAVLRVIWYYKKLEDVKVVAKDVAADAVAISMGPEIQNKVNLRPGNRYRKRKNEYFY